MDIEALQGFGGYPLSVLGSDLQTEREPISRESPGHPCQILSSPQLLPKLDDIGESHLDSEVEADCL